MAKKPVRTAKKATKRPATKRVAPAKGPTTLRAMLDMIDSFLSWDDYYRGEPTEIVVPDVALGGHFHSHVESAAKALGLKVTTNG